MYACVHACVHACTDRHTHNTYIYATDCTKEGEKHRPQQLARCLAELKVFRSTRLEVAGLGGLPLLLRVTKAARMGVVIGFRVQGLGFGV